MGQILSNCCDAQVRNGRCQDCKEMAGTYEEFDCETCEDTKEVTVDVWDNDSHRYQPTGTGRCPDCTGEDDADFSGATEGDR